MTHFFKHTICLLLLGQNVFAQDDLKALMSVAGNVFTELQKAILIRNDLSEATLRQCESLSVIFQKSKDFSPDLEWTGFEPAKIEELKVLNRQVLDDTTVLNQVLCESIQSQNLAKAKIDIINLKNKRNDAHTVFRPPTSNLRRNN